MKTSDFNYVLPDHFIAQIPKEPRDSSRLLVIHRTQDALEHTCFYNLPRFLSQGDVLVLNETKVIAARLYGRKIPSGGKVEILLVKQVNQLTWEVLVGGKNIQNGQGIQVDDGPLVMITGSLGGSRRHATFSEPITSELSRIGHVPLPPYIHTQLDDPARYQTIFANNPGSVAAPTAGLHFTERLMSRLRAKGIFIVFVTLHIGLDTFAPVVEEDIRKHTIHSEWCRLDNKAVSVINNARQSGKKIIAVGTTCVRTLETAYNQKSGRGDFSPFEGNTSLFITPGYQFKSIDAMITNFHLPRSTLIMMVSAFYNRRKILSTYETAMHMDYRFYSFGDAMLII